MSAGSGIGTLSVLVKYTMSKEVAELVKNRFEEMGFNDESVSYLDCVLFDAALEVLGIEQEYYGIGDEDWQATLADRAAAEKRYNEVKVIDVTDTWKEVLS